MFVKMSKESFLDALKKVEAAIEYEPATGILQNVQITTDEKGIVLCAENENMKVAKRIIAGGFPEDGTWADIEHLRAAVEALNAKEITIYGHSKGKIEIMEAC